MGSIAEYTLIGENIVPELKTKACYYRHNKTGAEILSLVNDDENKVFGITFRTPPGDSTGLPHILEHSFDICVIKAILTLLLKTEAGKGVG